MRRVRVAAVQLNSSGNVGQNLEQCQKLLAEAAQRGAKLVLLPENFAFMGPEAERARIAESITGSGPIVASLRDAAREHQIAIVAGGMPEASDNPARPFNTSLVFGPDGALLTSYRKVHLFDVDLPDGTKLCESASTLPGERPATCSVGSLELGVTICYDVRFPELYRKLVDKGANTLAVTAAFTVHTGRDHWEVLLRARAIESSCWLIAAAQWGKHPEGRVTYGRSMVIDPWGTVVAQASDGVGVVVADVDLDRLAEIRQALPSLRHRRL